MSSAHSLADLVNGCAGGTQSESLRSTSLSAAKAGAAIPSARASAVAPQSPQAANRRRRIAPGSINLGMSPP